MRSKIEIGNHSDVGRVRNDNEDYFGSYEGTFGSLLIICDGMGGHTGGQEASRIAVNSIKNHFIQLGETFDITGEIYNSIVEANKNILISTQKNTELNGMGSTLVLLFVKNDQAYYAHVGDSRIYMIRENKIHQLTKDHSLIQKLLDSGIVSEDNAHNHPNKNVITKALGQNKTIEPDIVGPMTVFKRDRFILCSDGLTTYLSNQEILSHGQSHNPQKASRILVDIANQRGGKDNITVQVVDIIKGKKLPNKNLLKLKKPKSLVVISAIFIFILAFIYINDLLFNETKLVVNGSYQDSTKATLDSLQNINDSSLVKPTIVIPENNNLESTSENDSKEETIESKNSQNKVKKEIYIVKKGETINGIANRKEIDADSLRKWNNIKNNMIQENQELKIYKYK